MTIMQDLIKKKDLGLECQNCGEVVRAYYLVGEVTILCKTCGDTSFPYAIRKVYDQFGKDIEIVYTNLDNENDYH